MARDVWGTFSAVIVASLIQHQGRYFRQYGELVGWACDNCLPQILAAQGELPEPEAEPDKATSNLNLLAGRPGRPVTPPHPAPLPTPPVRPDSPFA